MEKKPLDITNSESLKNKTKDVEIFGDPDMWILLCKASSKSQGWMKSTKIMDAGGNGVIVQVTTEFHDSNGCVVACAEAITHVPDAKIHQFTHRERPKYYGLK
jgi:hypothetical protein